MYMRGLLLYLSISSICLRTLSLLEEDSTLISSRVISLDPWDEVTPTRFWTSGRLFLRWSWLPTSL